MHWEANQCISIHMHAEFAYLYICTPRFRPRTCACISIHMHSKTQCFCMHIYTYAILDLHRLTYAFLDLHMYRYAFWRPSAHTPLSWNPMHMYTYARHGYLPLNLRFSKRRKCWAYWFLPVTSRDGTRILPKRNMHSWDKARNLSHWPSTSKFKRSRPFSPLFMFRGRTDFFQTHIEPNPSFPRRITRGHPPKG